jgi:hypothetical protein
MLKVKNAKHWDSTGNEFLEMLEKRGTKYKVMYKDLKVFEATTPGIAGGRHFNILDYHRKKDGQRILVANGGFGAGDVVVEEAYVMEVEEDKTYTKEEIAEALRDYIKTEEDQQI